MSDIKALFDKAGITQKRVIEDLGVSQPYASALMNGKSSIGKKLAAKLHALYGFPIEKLLIKDMAIKEGEDILHQASSLADLFNGKKIGEFDYPLDPEKKITDLGNGKYAFIVPLIPEYGYAGYVSGWKDHEYVEELPKHMVIVDQMPRSEYFAIETAGDSMENWTNEEMAKASIRDGEILTCRNLPKHHWKSRLHLHKFRNWAIVHKDGILIKRIINHDVENGIITCHSLNPDKTKYPDFNVDLREVYQLMNVVSPNR